MQQFYKRNVGLVHSNKNRDCDLLVDLIDLLPPLTQIILQLHWTDCYQLHRWGKIAVFHIHFQRDPLCGDGNRYILVCFVPVWTQSERLQSETETG